MQYATYGVVLLVVLVGDVRHVDASNLVGSLAETDQGYPMLDKFTPYVADFLHTHRIFGQLWKKKLKGIVCRFMNLNKFS